MDKLTKIIATIGPSSDSPETIEDLINLGVNIFRFNFKHSELDWHKERVLRVQEVSKKMNKPVSILLDLQGPEIRLRMTSENLTLEPGEKIRLLEKLDGENEKGFTLTTPEIISALTEGQKVYADGGLFDFTVRKENDKTYLESHSYGKLLNKKAVNIDGLDYDFPVIHEKEIEGLNLAKDLGIDFIALSFVRTASDIETLRDEMKKINLNSKIIAKIETSKSIENIDSVIDASDAIMIARGDLGVELAFEKVPYFQKTIIKKCLEKGVPVITATQMLESMTQSPIPTRAEVSDVANAIYDFTDAIMLSGETASGKYPKEAVKIMTKVARFSEDKNRIHDIRTLFDYDLSHKSQMICDSAFNLYKELKHKNHMIKGFLVFTQTGKTSRMLSRYRPHVPIYAFCPEEEIVKKLSISFGVEPIFQDTLREKNEIVKEDIQMALDILKEKGKCQTNDTFIVLHGDYWTSESGTSTIRILTA